MRIFISYSRDDKQWVYDLARTLRDRARHDVWWDQDLVVSQPWWDELLNQIEACDCFLLILTTRYVASIYCTAELEYAHALGKPILPLMMKPCDLPAILGPIQFYNVEGRPLSEVMVECMIGLREVELNVLKGKYPQPASIPPRPPVPRQKAPDPEDPFDLFNAAEEAALKGDLISAEKLYRKLKEIDPEGFGLEADERLNRLHFQRDGVTAYLKIVQQVDANNLDGARIAWRVYIRKYGASYDPKGYADLLSDTGSPARPPTGYLSRPTSIEVADILPTPFAWCPIPKGSVTLKDASYVDGTKGGRYKIAAFHMAKYPITNAQYQVFVDAPDGYIKENWWDYSAEARQWRKANPKAKDTAFEGNDLPRTNVSWYDAVAFCRWLSAKTGQNITLPTEQQWQRAAQGDDNREYPWGDEFDADRCNFNTSRPTSVTLYEPEGESPFHVIDMSGNVWEWCMTDWGTDSVRLDAKGARVVRGGSWGNYIGDYLRAANRLGDNPDFHGDYLGFRPARS